MYALVMALMLCVCGADISLRPRIAYGQDPLEEIRETIPVICETPPVEQTNSGYVLSGKAKAGVNQLISKLVDLNVEGAGSYHTEHSSGVLQQDLAKALANSNECKLTAFKILEEDIICRKLLVPSPVATPSPGSCVTNRYASSATATKGAFYLRFGFGGYLQPALHDNSKGGSPWLMDSNVTQWDLTPPPLNRGKGFLVYRHGSVLGGLDVDLLRASNEVQPKGVEIEKRRCSLPG